MGSLLYLRQGIEKSPYSYLLDPIYWEEICDIFVRDSCALMGMSVESPLSVRYVSETQFKPNSSYPKFFMAIILLQIGNHLQYFF